MAAWMVANSIAPDLVLCSTAERTRQTYEIVVPQLKPRPAKTLHLDSLYLADASSLLQAARALPAKVRHVLFIGHDPGMHDLAALLIGAGDPAVRAALRPKFPTAGLVVIDFDVGTWDEVGPGLGTLRHFMAPKRLPD